MKNKNVYDPLGIFKINNNKVVGDILVILPHDLKNSTKKYKAEPIYQYDVSSGGTNGILIIIKVTSKGNDVGDLRVAINPSDYHKISLNVGIENFNKEDKNCRFIIFHSNDFKDESEIAQMVIKCVKEFVSKNKYDPDKKFNFQDCRTLKRKLKPETAGSSILVGVYK